MSWIDIVILILQVLLGIAVFIVWRWIKELPAAIHKQQEQIFQHNLDLSKISHAELQLRKTEEFIAFANLQREILADKALLKKLKSGDTEAAEKLQKQILDLSTGLFFFASDETVKKYGEWKMSSSKGELEGIELLRQFGKLMVVLRKDLGQKETSLTEDDFLRLFVTDWHLYENNA